MKEFSGKAKTIDEALRIAAQAAIAERGPDAMINYKLKEVKGLYGGIAGFDEKEVIIQEIDIVPTEFCGEVVEYRAFQVMGAVTLLAYGSHPTAGFKVRLQRKPVEIFPPEFALTHTRPTGPVAQVVTPFVVSESFNSTDPIDELKVEDAEGEHSIRVSLIDS
jgi:hypothetical protein